jgi:hypothetical protein
MKTSDSQSSGDTNGYKSKQNQKFREIENSKVFKKNYDSQDGPGRNSNYYHHSKTNSGNQNN